MSENDSSEFNPIKSARGSDTNNKSEARILN